MPTSEKKQKNWVVDRLCVLYSDAIGISASHMSCLAGCETPESLLLLEEQRGLVAQAARDGLRPAAAAAISKILTGEADSAAAAARAAGITEVSLHRAIRRLARALEQCR